MKVFLKLFKRQDGFTLVELMVVVAIIGLLSAVAIPNFKKYQAKAKMSEAKLQLSAVYTAQAAFYSDFNMYHNCLAYMGFNPQKDAPNRYYAVGITEDSAINANAMTSAENAGLLIADCPAVNAAVAPADANAATAVTSNMAWFMAGKGVGGAMANTAAFIPTTDIGSQATQADMVYIAGAGGVIDGDFTLDTSCSQLTVNEQKRFVVVRNGY